MNQEVICIVCPRGCHIQVYEENETMVCEGNACSRGEVYAKQEVLSPKRMLTSSVKITHALHARCPVMSTSPIPKERIFDVLEVLKSITLQAPVHIHDVIVKDVLGLGIDIVATRSCDKII